VPEIFDLFLFIVFVIVQWCISTALWKAHRRPLARVSIVLFEALVACGYACTFAGPGRLTVVPGGFAEVAGAAALLYLVTSSFVWAIYWTVGRIRKHFAAPTNAARRQLINAAGNLAMAAPFAVMGYGALIERTRFRVREVDAFLPGLAPGLDGLRILQLSDIHMGPFLSESDLARVVDMAMELKPHLAVITGDLISTRGDPLDACIRQLARVKADAGVFGCMGNHEHYARAEDYVEQAAARSGIRFLRGQSQQLQFGGATLNLAGVDHQSSTRGKKSYLVGAERMVVPGAFNLLLSHNPAVFPVAANQGYNLMLSGHTHGGQINVEIYDQSITPARFFTHYIYGLYHAQGAAAYVTRGIGTIAIPVRIGAPPEITVIRLRKA
jgi:predicted MPP superfamily phosphohydrolase